MSLPANHGLVKGQTWPVVPRVDESRECTTDHMTGWMLVAPVAPHLVSVAICRCAFCDVTEMSVLLLGYLLLFM